MFYDRKIKYVDVYENGEKVQNAGFVRVEARENKVKLQLQVAGLKATDTINCPVVLMGAGKEASLGELRLERGRGVVEFATLETTDLAGGIGYRELEEIQIRPGGVRLLRCVVQEGAKRNVIAGVERRAEEKVMIEEGVTTHTERPAIRDIDVNVQAGESQVEQEMTVTEEQLVQVEDTQRAEELPAQVPDTHVRDAGATHEMSEVKSEAELLKEAFLAEKRMREGEGIQAVQQERQSVPQPAESATVEDIMPATPKTMQRISQNTVVQSPQPIDKWQQLLAIYPHIRPFEDRREYLLMKPQDFVVLTDKYFSLSGNSFLLHGYYNYDHLIMSKERRPEGERFYIGVPGNFYDKEKQVAIMFGFESFEGKREPARTGDFGYYMIPVEI